MALTLNLPFTYWSVQWSRLWESSHETETTLSNLHASWTFPWYDQSWVVSVYSGVVKVCFWPAVRIYFWRGHVIIIVINTSFEATTPYLAICDFHFSIKLTINSIIVCYGIYSKVVGTTCCSVMSVYSPGRNVTSSDYKQKQNVLMMIRYTAEALQCP